MELKNPSDQNPVAEELRAKEENPSSVDNSDVNEQNAKAPKKVSTRKPKSVKIAAVAEEEGHHPDMTVTYGGVTIELMTHAIGGLSENDFILAAKIDQIGK